MLTKYQRLIIYLLQIITNTSQIFIYFKTLNFNYSNRPELRVLKILVEIANYLTYVLFLVFFRSLAKKIRNLSFRKFS